MDYNRRPWFTSPAMVGFGGFGIFADDWPIRAASALVQAPKLAPVRISGLELPTGRSAVPRGLRRTNHDGTALINVLSRPRGRSRLPYEVVELPMIIAQPQPLQAVSTRPPRVRPTYLRSERVYPRQRCCHRNTSTKAARCYRPLMEDIKISRLKLLLS
jgi:hypothetical protein